MILSSLIKEWWVLSKWVAPISSRRNRLHSLKEGIRSQLCLDVIIDNDITFRLTQHFVSYSFVGDRVISRYRFRRFRNRPGSRFLDYDSSVLPIDRCCSDLDLEPYESMHVCVRMCRHTRVRDHSRSRRHKVELRVALWQRKSSQKNTRRVCVFLSFSPLYVCAHTHLIAEAVFGERNLNIRRSRIVRGGLMSWSRTLNIKY